LAETVTVMLKVTVTVTVTVTILVTVMIMVTEMVTLAVWLKCLPLIILYSSSKNYKASEFQCEKGGI